MKEFGTFPYYFYDFNGKYTLPLSSENLLTVSGFYSRDFFIVFESENAIVVEKRKDPNWGNLVGSFKYNHLFDNGDIEFGAYYSRMILDSDARGFSSKYIQFTSIEDSLNAIEYIFINNDIEDMTLKAQLKLYLTGQAIIAGVEFKNLSTHYFWDINEQDIGSSINGNLTDVFFDFAPDKFKYSDRTEIYSLFFFRYNSDNTKT